MSEPQSNIDPADEIARLESDVRPSEGSIQQATHMIESDEVAATNRPLQTYTRLQTEDGTIRGSGWVEWLKFLAFLIVIGATLFIISLLRPIIFDQIVPAVLGTDKQQETIILPDPDPSSNSLQDTGRNEELVAPGSATDQQSGAAASGQGQGFTSEQSSGQNPAASNLTGSTDGQQGSQSTNQAGVGDQIAPILHTVQPGETLVSIGDLYDISPVVLATTNKLANPNNIQIGTQLTIPREAITGK